MWELIEVVITGVGVGGKGKLLAQPESQKVSVWGWEQSWERRGLWSNDCTQANGGQAPDCWKAELWIWKRRKLD